MLSSATSSSLSYGASRFLRRLARRPACYVGIDIGIDHVHVATLGSNPATSSIRKPEWSWVSQSNFQVPVDPQLPPQPDWIDVVAGCLVDRLPRCVDGELNHAVISLPLPWIHYQTTSEPVAASQEQCNAMFAASIFQSDAHLSNWPVVSGNDQCLIAATAESAACQIAQAVAGLGYHVQAILPHGVALLQAAPTLTSLTPSAILLLELSGGLVAVRNDSGCGLCRNLPACSISTGALPQLDELEPWLGEITSEVNATSRYVSRLSSEIDTQSPILICGGAGQIHGMDAALATMLGRPVAVWRFAGRRRPRRHRSITPSHVDSRIAVSLSLACCGLNDLAWAGRRDQ